MNFTDYTYLINKPDAINERQSIELDKISTAFPYFQSARVLRLKHLFNQESYAYNTNLKTAAAYTTDRSILFDFITSDNFTTVQRAKFDAKIQHLLNINVSGVEIIIPTQKEIVANTLEQSILNSIEIATPQKIEEKLEIGKPLEFSVNEKHSFQEWLQLSRLQPIVRNEKIAQNTLEEDKKEKKDNLINKFIATNPKIPALTKNHFEPLPSQPTIEEKSYLMTETLAKVYLEQKKYDKAIQAYEILILKYPEKSSFFAIRISDIKNLQQNNNS